MVPDTVPAACAASNQARMEKGLISRDGWAVWDDIDSLRMVPTNISSTIKYREWHVRNTREVTDGE